MGGKPTADQVERRTIERLKKFTEHIESGGPVHGVYSCKKVVLEVGVEQYTAERVKQVRALLQLSQALFARFLNVSVSTVQKWERGARPDGAACRLMDEIMSDPDYWKRRLRSMTKTIAGSSRSVASAK